MGGLFNPIVVLDGSARKQVGCHYAYENVKYEDEQLSLLKAFDPDLLINYSSADLPEYFLPFRNRICPHDVMRSNPWGRGETSAFLEVWPFLAQLWRQEVRFLPKPTTKFGYIDLDAAGDLKTYLAARFGSYPQDSNGNEILVKNFGAQLVTYDDGFRKSFSPREWLFPIGITTFQLDIAAPCTLGSHIFFLLDTNNVFDIVDYWNLRAAGYRVFPLPISHYRDFSESGKEFAKRSVYSINQTVSTLVEIVKARSVEDTELEKAGQWLTGLGADLERLSLRGWVPRFQTWDCDTRMHPEMEIRPPVSEEHSEVVVFNDGYGTLRATPPDCHLRAQYMSQRWVAEIQAFGTTDADRAHLQATLVAARVRRACQLQDRSW